MVHSDHNSLETILKVLFNKKVQKPMHKVKFYEFMNNKAKMLFNKNLKHNVENCVDLGHDECCKQMSDSAKHVAHEKHEDNKGLGFYTNEN